MQPNHLFTIFSLLIALKLTSVFATDTLEGRSLVYIVKSTNTHYYACHIELRYVI